MEKRIVAAVPSPRAFRYGGKVYEAPMHFGLGWHAEVVAYGRGNVQTSSHVFGVFGALVAKYVGPVIGGEWATIFPLSVTDFFAVDDLKPAAFTRGFARSLVRSLMPPWNHPACVWAVCFVIEAVIVRQGDIKGVELRCKCLGPILNACCLIWVVIATIIFLPTCVP